MSAFLSKKQAAVLLGAAICATAAALGLATNGNSAAAPASCPSVPTSATVGFTAAGSVGAVSAAPVSPQPSSVVHRARKTVHGKRRAAGAPPGQMPPYINKHAADPACVPTAVPTAGGTPGAATTSP